MLNSLGDPYLQMHFGDPGDDGTSNVAATSARQLADLITATGPSRTLVNPVEWSVVWAGGNQTVTHLSAWSASTGGNFLFSVALASQVDFTNGMVPRLTGLSVVVPSVAAD
jgi:hypothetical protein